MNYWPSKLSSKIGIYFCFFSAVVEIVYIFRYRKLLQFAIGQHNASEQMLNDFPCISLGFEAVSTYEINDFGVVHVLVYSVPVDHVINNLFYDEVRRMCFVLYLLR